MDVGIWTSLPSRGRSLEEADVRLCLRENLPTSINFQKSSSMAKELLRRGGSCSGLPPVLRRNQVKRALEKQDEPFLDCAYNVWEFMDPRLYVYLTNSFQLS
eukprot:gb/GECG01013994.1/.p1 GENE.gb/GECG01013994.1/~~gb/GECG01013994.1/.p1  ORF type:complete len:102 (+),score=9.53 gb/GECG01013994.1/:1-306(+)